jgi:hypothetical protein
MGRQGTGRRGPSRPRRCGAGRATAAASPTRNRPGCPVRAGHTSPSSHPRDHSPLCTPRLDSAQPRPEDTDGGAAWRPLAAVRRAGARLDTTGIHCVGARQARCGVPRRARRYLAPSTGRGRSRYAEGGETPPLGRSRAAIVAMPTPVPGMVAMVPAAPPSAVAGGAAPVRVAPNLHTGSGLKYGIIAVMPIGSAPPGIWPRTPRGDLG